MHFLRFTLLKTWQQCNVSIGKKLHRVWKYNQGWCKKNRPSTMQRVFFENSSSIICLERLDVDVMRCTIESIVIRILFLSLVLLEEFFFRFGEDSFYANTHADNNWDKKLSMSIIHIQTQYFFHSAVSSLKFLSSLISPFYFSYRCNSVSQFHRPDDKIQCTLTRWSRKQWKASEYRMGWHELASLVGSSTKNVQRWFFIQLKSKLHLFYNEGLWQLKCLNELT